MQISVREAAAILNVSDETIYKWVKQDVIPSHTVNDQIRFNRAELLEWTIENNIQALPHLFTGHSLSKTRQPTISEALKEGGITYGVGGTDAASVLREVVNIMKLPETIDRDFLYQVLLARERLGSTGIGDGIAIPHVRNPVVLHVSQPIVSLCFLATPIDFRAIDGKPVNTLFMLISPTVQTHLHLLSRLGFILRNRELKAALKQQAAPDELMTTITAAESQIKR